MIVPTMTSQQLIPLPPPLPHTPFCSPPKISAKRPCAAARARPWPLRSGGGGGADMDAAARGGGLYRHLGTGRTYARLGEAFAHPDGAREGRLDVVLGEVSAEAAPASTGAAPAGRLVTVPFAELHGSGAAAPVLERLEPGGGGHGVGGGAEAVLGVGAPRYYRHFKGKLYQESSAARRACPAAARRSSTARCTHHRTRCSRVQSPTSRARPGRRPLASGGSRTWDVSPEELGADAAARAQRPCLAPPPAGPAACSSSVALVTGASAGLGREAAVQLAAAGFLVFAAARSAERLAEDLMKEADAAGRPPPRIVALTLDVRSQDSVQRAFHEVQERAGRLDVLVNNAGVLVVGTVEMYR
ncbi:unnamed protein product [Prorocentrum cordatum]|uniref:Protochlorophyllide reductase n=1 Tax=Prorocentrum cordatum TaxID=2364126 RepID=A0ABN9T3P9_9DINO|nr:unnamed protein product [Polarella glacialis]